MGARGLTVSGVPAFPSWLIFVKGAILVFSLIILALGAYATTFIAGGAAGFDIFVAIKTLIVFGATVAIERLAPQSFFRIIFFVAYILGIIFWLSAWAWSASTAAFLLAYAAEFDYYSNSKVSGPAGALAACAGLGALVWVMSIVHFVFFIRACLSSSPAAATPLQTGFGHAPAPGQYPQGQYAAQPQYGQQPGNPYGAEQKPEQQPYSPQPYATQQFPSHDQYQTQQYPAPSQSPAPYPAPSQSPAPYTQQQYQTPYQQPYASQ